MTTLSIIPALYRMPLGLPLRWQDEQSGVLPEAVKSYFKNEATPPQLQLVIAYLKYYITAPCWAANTVNDETREALTKLQEGVETLSSAKSILDWIYKCLELGIDPL